MIQESVNVDVLQRGTLFVPSSPKLIDTVMRCYLGNPWTERHHLIFLVQHPVELQEDFGSGILSIFELTEKLSADLQNVAMMSNVEHSQKIGRDWRRLNNCSAHLTLLGK
jgi:hypothetical protein